MSWVTDIQLQSFRCYGQARLGGLGPGAVVLHGENGAGKTNVLEAVSLLSPGRGLRGAKMADIQNRDLPAPPWSVAAKVETPYGQTRIGTGGDPDKDRRIVRINGEAARGQNALAEYLSCVWLTPQMDRLFIEAASGRRRFLDRLVFSFDSGHSGRVTRYENALRQRAKLLQDGGADPQWLDALEDTMAESGVAVAAARQDFTVRLQQACDRAAADSPFPRARLAATGTIEDLLRRAPAVEVEDLFRYQLRDSRPRDAVTGGAATGPHKGDLSVSFAAKNMAADQCSTGEQKALLIGMILAHSRLIAAERGAPPILLLDEVAAHLDEGRRDALYAMLLSLGGQVWLTGAGRDLFAGLAQEAAFFSVENSRIAGDDAGGFVTGRKQAGG